MKINSISPTYYPVINEHEPTIQITKKDIKISFNVEMDYKRKEIWSSIYNTKPNINRYFLSLLFLVGFMYQVDRIPVDSYLNYIGFKKESK